jgi:hypothetical protein
MPTWLLVPLVVPLGLLQQGCWRCILFPLGLGPVGLPLGLPLPLCSQRRRSC